MKNLIATLTADYLAGNKYQPSGYFNPVAPPTVGQVKAVLHALAEVLRDQLLANGDVIVPNVVRLRMCKTKPRPERAGRNFKGETVVIPAKPAGCKVVAQPMGALRKINKVVAPPEPVAG